MKKHLGFIILWIAWAAMACFLLSLQVQVNRMPTNQAVWTAFGQTGNTIDALAKSSFGKMDKLEKQVADHEKRLKWLEADDSMLMKWHNDCQKY